MVKKCIAAGIVCSVGLVGAAQASETFDFPSANSSVVGSVGFINTFEIGWFWSASRGDSVQESFTSNLGAVDRTILDLDVVNNGLSQIGVDWRVLLNGTAIGSFTVGLGFTGPLSVDLMHSPVGAVGGAYDLRIEVTNEVPGGGGAHTLGYAAPHPSTVTFIPSPGAIGLLALGGFAATRRRRS